MSIIEEIKMTPQDHKVLDIIADLQSSATCDSFELISAKEAIKLEQVHLSVTTLMNILRRPQIKPVRIFFEEHESKALSFEFIFDDVHSAHLLLAAVKAYGHTEVNHYNLGKQVSVEIMLACLADKKLMMFELQLHKFPIETAK